MTNRARPRSVAGILRRAFTAVIGILFLGGTAAVVAALVVYRAGDEQLKQIVDVRTANLDVRRALTGAEIAMDNYVLTGSSDDLEHAAAAELAYGFAIEELRHVSFPEDLPYVRELADAADAWWHQSHLIARAAPDTLPTEVYVESNSLYRAALDASVTIDERVTARSRDVIAGFDTLNIQRVASLAALIIVAALLTVLIGTRTSKQITVPLAAIAGEIDALRRGDFEPRIDVRGMPLEIAHLAATTNLRADELAQTRELDDAFQHLSIELRLPATPDELLERAAAGFGRIFTLADVTILVYPDADNPVAHVVSWDHAGRTRHVREQVTTDAYLPHQMPAHDPDAVDPQLGVALLRAHVSGKNLSIPISERSALVGTVILVGGDRGVWRPFEVQFAERLAADLGRALGRARHFEQEQKLVSQLKELDAARTEFISTVSHELRTPLTSIKGFAEILADEEAGPITPRQRKMLGTIERNVVRLQGMIENLLTMSRLELGSAQTEMRPVDLGNVVESTRATFEPAAASADVNLAYEVRGPVRINGDELSLDRVIINLVSNAIKFTPHGGAVTVLLHSTDGEAVLVVKDTGIGIPAEDQDKVFGRFFRAGNALDRVVAGTGIGLAIVSTIVEQHLGTVSLTSEVGHGTTVTVRLPLLEDRELSRPPAATDRR
ncbi:ATP-binding protein [Cellulomonas sp. URHE0023]|uniref:sensor histidine kinase n=1 Tax=Cellulomonas sp. URHE0023 TaxID=1380354 RepID=UPI0006907A1D|nr:ATP-binding protein [Cellulomonas sp. URHE0023]